jgi:DNA repair exonuclease SbcCD ATPase subunit
LNILEELGKLISPNDPELVEKTLARLNEQDNWNDVFSTKLLELLDKIDQIKSEIRQRLREADQRIQRAESVTQAESALLEKAKNFGDLSERLERAQAAQERASALAMDAKRRFDGAKEQLEDATKTLEYARELTENAHAWAQYATEKLTSAREVELNATRLSRLTVRCAVLALALSWIAMGWIGWLAVRTMPVFWVSAMFTVLIVVAALFVVRRVRDDA